MDGGDLQCQQFLSFEKVMQVGLAVCFVYVRGTVRIQRRKVVFPFLITQVHNTILCEQHGITPVTRRHHAVEHVDSTLYAFKDIHRRADPHQITWLVFRQDSVDDLNHFVHHLRRFAHSQSTDGIAIGLL